MGRFQTGQSNQQLFEFNAGLRWVDVSRTTCEPIASLEQPRLDLFRTWTSDPAKIPFRIRNLIPPDARRLQR